MSLGCGKGQEDCRFSFCCSGFFHQHGLGFISEWVCFVVVRRIYVCLTVMLPVTLFLSPCKQPLKAWCTLRNNLRQNILTRHWEIINCLSSLSFIQSKVRSDSKWLNYIRHMRIYIQALVSCVRLKILHSYPSLLCLSIHACGSYRCCI